MPYCAHMPINGCNAFVRSGLQQFATDDLLDCQDDTIFTSDPNRGSAILYCLDCIFDLEVSAIGGEDRVRQVVARTY